MMKHSVHTARPFSNVRFLAAIAVLVVLGYVLLKPNAVPGTHTSQGQGVAVTHAQKATTQGTSSSTGGMTRPAGKDTLTPASKSSSTMLHRVPVTLFVMSQCPDARDCEKAFDGILQPLKDIVDFRTEYISQIDNGSVTCMHGPQECTGNLHQLCAQQHTPVQKRVTWLLKLLNCMWGDFSRIGSKKGLVDCLEVVGMTGTAQSSVLKCVEGAEGSKLLVASAKLVKERGVRKSCTVFIADKLRCIHDGGTWYDCPGGSTDKDFARSICGAFKAATGRDAPGCSSHPVLHKLM